MNYLKANLKFLLLFEPLEDVVDQGIAAWRFNDDDSELGHKHRKIILLS